MTILHSFLAFFTISQIERHQEVCKSSNMHSWHYTAGTKIDTLFLVDFHRFSKCNMNQIKHFIDQNLSWLIENQILEVKDLVLGTGHY